MRSTLSIFVFAVAAILAAPSWAAQTTTVTESFDGTLADATWRLGTFDEITPDGGSPGAYLHNPTFDAAVPTPHYIGSRPSPFFGDYRAAKVVSLGLDVDIFSVDKAVDPTRPIAVVLASDMGTPEDPTDDCEAYFVSPKPLPRPGTGWRSYDFRIPSDETSVPNHWIVRGPCAGLSGDAAWNAVITNVTDVTFPFADPDTLWYFQIWDLGIDSIRITFNSGS
jgi:hypothetical protein